MPYVFPRSCISRKSLNDVINKPSIYDTLCQIFVTNNIIILFYKETGDIYIYYRKSFHIQRIRGINEIHITEKMSMKLKYIIANDNYTFYGSVSGCMPKKEEKYGKNIYFTNMRKFAEHKLNYSRTCKDIRYQKYINYLAVIENIMERLFGNIKT